MSFNIKVQIDTSGVKPAMAGVRTELSGAEDDAKALGEAGKKAGSEVAKGAKEAADALAKQAAAAAKAKDAADALAAAAGKSAPKAGGAGAAAEWAKTTEALIKSEQALSQQAAAQQAVIDRLAAPAKRYAEQLTVLDALQRQGRISASDYANELQRLDSMLDAAHGKVQGPQRDPTQQALGVASLGPLGAGGKGGGKEGGGKGGGEGGALDSYIEALAPRLGVAGEALAGFATKGTIAAGVVVALGFELAHLGDEYILLSNAAQKVTDKYGTVNDTLQKQYNLSKQLHGSIESTLELYDAVRDGTDELNLTQAEQLRLTKQIGDAVLAEGKTLGAAEGLMSRLTYALAAGTISGRELKGVLKDFPDIGAAFVEAMGHSRKELVDMANKGMISAEMLIDAFGKMEREMGGKVEKRIETTSQKWQHFKDEITLDLGTSGISKVFGSSLDAALSYKRAMAEAAHSYSNLISGGAVDAAEKVMAEQERLNRLKGEEVEIAKKLKSESEKNAKAAEIAAAAKSIGVAFPAFDEDLANKAGAARAASSRVGFEIGDAFQEAHTKATLFGNKLYEIQERKDMEHVADDVHRIWDALHGADDLIYEQVKAWGSLTDKIAATTKALEKWKTTVPTTSMSSGQHDQEGRDFARQARDLESEQKLLQYGRGVVGSVQGKSMARDQLEDWTRAAKAGEVTAEAFRKKYDETMTTMNDGRLPSIIRLWEGFTLPLRDWGEDARALAVTFDRGTITAAKYGQEIAKLSEAHSGWRKEQIAELEAQRAGLAVERERAAITSANAFRGAALVTVDQGVRIEGAQKSAAYIANQDPDNQKGLALRKETLDQLSQASAAIAGSGTSGDAFRQFNDELERSHKIAAESVKPLVDYENKLRDLQQAVKSWGLSQADAEVLQRKALSDYRAAAEALRQLPGPTGEYEHQLRVLNDQFKDGVISADQYSNGIDRARVAYLQATGAAKEFSGAMEIQWVKMAGEVDQVGAAIADRVVAGFDKMNDALVQAANGAEVSWSNLASSIIQDIERIALKMLEVGLIKGAISLVSSAAGGGEAAAATAAADGLAGYASGGTYKVGGSGGTDSQLQMFWATPGEQVTVSQPGAYPFSRDDQGGRPQPAVAGGRGGNDKVILQVVNQYDASVGTAALASQPGQQSLLNIMRAERSAIMGALGIRRDRSR